jgi:hypothetical protein
MGGWSSDFSRLGLAVNFLPWVVEIGHGDTDEEGGHGGFFGFIFSVISSISLAPR